MINKSSDTVTTDRNDAEFDMISAAFDFWFKDDAHIRSPFPVYIRDGLRTKSEKLFQAWSSRISEDARKDINEEILAEKFEEILFEQALLMVLTEDEKLTIKYPFMPRIGDVIMTKGSDHQNPESKVIDRYKYKKGDEAFLKVKLKNLLSGENWETDFELPE